MSDSNTTEEIIGSLVNVSGHTFDIRYDLFFTTERLIAAIVQHPADGQSPSVWKTMLLGDVLGGQTGRLEKVKTGQKRRRSFQGMTPDELASANAWNFAIPYSEIGSAEIKRRFLQWQLRFRLSTPSNQGRVIRFGLAKKQVAEAQRLLEVTLQP